MKLRPVDTLPNLEALELEDIYLFGKHGANVYLHLSIGNVLQILIKENKKQSFFHLDQKKEAQEYYDSLFVVPLEVCQDKEKLKEFILNCETECTYKLNGLTYQSFTIESKFSNDTPFSWSLRGRITNVYPMKDRTYVKGFKTEIGAKRSLIKYLDL
jgi:hypothetical protein